MEKEQNATMEFACGRCETRLNVKPFLAGKKINCPKCHKKVVVPKQNGGIAAVPEGTNLKIRDAVTARKRHDASSTPTRTRPRGGSEGTTDQGMLRAENKALRDRLEKRKHESSAWSEGDRDALAVARKRIEDLERQLSQARTEADGARARAAAAIRDRKDKSSDG